MEVGLVGKPNVGKSTFFSAATLAPAQIADYPFTTIEPNRGVAYVRVLQLFWSRPPVCSQTGAPTR